jgi:hypothetical protein
MKTPSIIAAVLLPLSAFANSWVDISASISKYHISGADNYSKGNTLILPRVSSKFGKEALIQITQEYHVPTEWDSDKTPKAFSSEDLGVKLFITIHRDGNRLFYSGQLQLAQLARLKDPSSPIQKSITPFKGTADSIDTVRIPSVSPDGKKISLILNLKEVEQDAAANP